MQFTYDEFCGSDFLEIKDEVYNYLIKARRHKIDDEILNSFLINSIFK